MANLAKQAIRIIIFIIIAKKVFEEKSKIKAR